MAKFFYGTTNSYITTTSGGPSDTDNFTIFGICKPETVTVAGHFPLVYVGHGNDNGAGYGIYIRHNDFTVRVDIAFVADYNSLLTVRLNQWNYIACVRNAGTWRLWVNGVKSSATSASTPFVTDGRYTIGARPNSSGVMDWVFFGAIAETAFWSGLVLPDSILQALTLGRITPLQLARSSLIQYHPLRFFGGGTSEPFLLKGKNLTRSHVAPYPHPDLHTNFMPYFNSNPVVAGTAVKMQAVRGWSWPI